MIIYMIIYINIYINIYMNIYNRNILFTNSVECVNLNGISFITYNFL